MSAAADLESELSFKAIMVKLPDSVMKLPAIPYRQLKGMCHFGPASPEIKDARALLVSLGFETDAEEAYRLLHYHHEAGNICLIDKLKIPERPMSNEEQLAEVESLHNAVVEAQAERDEMAQEVQMLKIARQQDRELIEELRAALNEIRGQFDMKPVPEPKKSESARFEDPNGHKPPKPPTFSRLAKAKAAPQPADPQVVFSGQTVPASAVAFEKTLQAPTGFGTGEKHIISAQPKPAITGELSPIATLPTQNEMAMLGTE